MQPDRRRRVLRCMRVVLRCSPAQPPTEPDDPTWWPHNGIRWDEPSKEVSVWREDYLDEPRQWYRFDEVFPTTTTQKRLYYRLAFPILVEVFSGGKCTIMAYGQTGTGKTYTMMGEASPDAGFTWRQDSQAGIIPRFIHHIFERLSDCEFSVKVSLLEIYKEELFDLLGEEVAEQRQHPQLSDDPQYGTVVRGLREVTVSSADEAFPILEGGFARRKTAHTSINTHSSRSHVVLTVTIWKKDRNGRTLTGTLNLVDPASNQNFSHWRVADDERAQPARNITQFLVPLSRVIVALAQSRSPVPHRDSVLTRVLQTVLGGRAKTTVIATVPGTFDDPEETLIMLQHASNFIKEPEVGQTVRERVPTERAAEEEDSPPSPYTRLL